MLIPRVFFLFAYWHEPGWKGFVGATVKIRDLAVNLSAMGHEVVLFVPRCGIDKSGFDFEVVEIPVIDLPGLRMLSFNLFLALRLFSGGFAVRPGVVYLRRTTSIVPILYARLVHALFFFEVNDDPYYGAGRKKIPFTARLRNFLSVKMDEVNIRSADRVFVISRDIMEKIGNNLAGLERESLVLMASGANTDLFSPGDHERARARCGLDPGREYVCFMGSLLAHQGVGALIHAAPLILKVRPGCRFLVIGEGPMRGEWEAEVAALGLCENFIFTGQIPYDQAPDRIRAADLCVAPYLPDAGLRSPVKIFDYLACGKPVVASDVPGTTGIFKGLDAVVPVTPGDPAMLARAIVSLLENRKLRMRMGAAGRAWVCANFSRRMMAGMVARTAKSLAYGKTRGGKGAV
ncbi:MAG: glycosyltransferase family 4 protein [Deltaproteobacteria bacterium]|nr:glycosyltransferase family 4 protein [Deltaproteobacteria bacterium]